MKMKNFIITILVIIILPSTSSAMSEGFNDVTSDKWFYEAVNKMSQSGIIKGYPDGTFKPNGTVTYAEFVKMFIVAVTDEDLGNSDTGHWSKNYYDKGIELGLFIEYDIKESDLDNEIPRKIMAFITANNFYGTSIDNYESIEASIPDLYVGEPYKHEIIKSYGMGIITGYEDGSFQPDGTLTRAESATVINRVINEDERIIPDIEPAGNKEDYWKKDKDYKDLVKWIAEGREDQERYINGSNYLLENGVLYFTEKDGTKWCLDDTNEPDIHEHVYAILSRYARYVEEHTDDTYKLGIHGMYHPNDGGVVIISIYPTRGATTPMLYFKVYDTPSAWDFGTAKGLDVISPYIAFNQTAYFTSAQSEAISYEEWLAHDRVLDTGLVDMNREILKDVYGEITGNKIMDYAYQNFQDQMDKETREWFNLPERNQTIDGVDVSFYDDSNSMDCCTFIDFPSN